MSYFDYIDEDVLEKVAFLEEEGVIDGTEDEELLGRILVEFEDAFDKEAAMSMAGMKTYMTDIAQRGMRRLGLATAPQTMTRMDKLKRFARQYGPGTALVAGGATAGYGVGTYRRKRR